MFDVLENINWLAVIIAGFVYYMLGGFWFSAGAFQKVWDKAIGFDRPKKWKPTSLYYVGPLVGCLASSVAVAVLAQVLHLTSLGDALTLGLVVGIGFAAAITFTNSITPKTPNPLLFGTLVGVYHVLGIVIVAAIVYGWQ
jgi:predicted transporter